MAEISYSDMNERELLTHIARNTDQLIGAMTGITSQEEECPASIWVAGVTWHYTEKVKHTLHKVSGSGVVRFTWR